MIPEQILRQAPDRLFEEVGGFFANTSRGAGRCTVCTGPATRELCDQCAGQREKYGSALADLVVPLAYVKGKLTPRHQSEHHVYRYKNRLQPSAECLRDLKLMMLTATWLHGECIARTVGWWEVVTFVSSADRPGPAHPVVDLARQVAPWALDAKRVLLDVGPDITADPQRWPLPERFVVPEKFVPTVQGRHVLVVDDTWVSGAKAQSASIALKAAGASLVTVVCIGRWLSWQYNEAHQALITSLKTPYNAIVCPVTGGTCPPP